MDRKPIQVEDKNHEVLRLEAIRQTFEKKIPVTMNDVLTPFIRKLNKKYKHIKEII